MPTQKHSRSAAPTRLATVYTWRPATRVERTIRRRRLPFTGDARDLIRRAAQLVAPKRPFRVMLTFTPSHQVLELQCGADRHGVHTHVSVALYPADVGLLTYFVRGQSLTCVLFADLPNDRDGEDLVLPRVSVDELAAMSVRTGTA